MKAKVFQLLCFVIVFSGCQSGSNPTGAAAELSGFQTEKVSGTDLERVFLADSQGTVLEEGFTRNGMKEGTWVTYFPENGFPKTVASFAGGMYNGPYIGFNDRGNVDLRAYYKNNLLHGFWSSYKFARPTETREYDSGKLHGVLRKFNDRTDKLLEEIHYKNDKYDGPYRFYNDAGQVTVEYLYQEGEKISGGEILTTGEQ